MKVTTLLPFRHRSEHEILDRVLADFFQVTCVF